MKRTYVSYLAVRDATERLRNDRPGSYYRLVVLATIAKTFRFISVLVPFKAIVVAINPTFTFSLGEMVVTNYQIAAGLLAIAVSAFLINSFAVSIFERKLRELNIERDSDWLTAHQLTQEALPEENRLFGDSIEFHASLLIAGLLLLGISLFDVVSFLTNTILLGAFLLIGEKKYLSDRATTSAYGGFAENYSYAAQVVVICSLLVSIYQGVTTGYLAVVFAFIATRHIWSSLSDAGKILAKNSFSRLLVDRRSERALVEAAPEFDEDSVDPFFNAKDRPAWLKSLLSRLLHRGVVVQDCQWRDLGVRHTFSFFLTALDAHSQKQSHYLLNIYRPRNIHLALRERDYALQGCFDQDEFEYAGSTHFEAYFVNAYKHTGLRASSRDEYLEASKELLAGLWNMPLPDFGAEKQAKMLDLHTLRRGISILLGLSTTDEQRTQLSGLRTELKDLNSRYCAIPMAICNPEISVRTTMVNNNGKLIFSPSGRASIEPIGSSIWRMSNVASTDLDGLCELINRQRETADRIQSEDLLLASLAQGLVVAFNNEAYGVAMERAEKLAALLEKPLETVVA